MPLSQKRRQNNELSPQPVPKEPKSRSTKTMVTENFLSLSSELRQQILFYSFAGTTFTNIHNASRIRIGGGEYIPHYRWDLSHWTTIPIQHPRVDEELGYRWMLTLVSVDEGIRNNVVYVFGRMKGWANLYAEQLWGIGECDWSDVED